MTDRPRTAVCCAMRNEGQFLLEWVAYYKEIGFDEIILMTNDCTDGTDALAARLQQLGEITHIDNTPIGEMRPLERMVKRALEHEVTKGCDWLMLADADEFPLISYGAGGIQDLLAAMPGHTDCIAFHWRAFGNAGITDFPEGGDVMALCTQAQAEPELAGFHKCMFRPNKFASANDHLPKEPYGTVITRNMAGTEMNSFSCSMPPHTRFRRNKEELWNWDGGAMHHYAIRADDVFMMKTHRGAGRSGKTTKYYLNSNFYQRFNCNEVEDRAIQRHLPAVQARKAAYLKDPELGLLHPRAIAAFQQLKSQILTPEQRAEWTKPAPQPEPQET